jgi:hypothetical protein
MRVRMFFGHTTRGRRLRAFRAVTTRSRIVGLFLLAGLAVSAPAATPAQAISMDKSSTIREQCEIEIGPDVIQIVSYMPDRSRDRFCSDFPATGRIVLTIDLVATRLRDIPIEVRLVREPKGPLDEDADLAAVTVATLPPRVYPGGSVVVDHVFDAPGNYAAFITAVEPSGTRRMTRFGFTVGGRLLFYTPALLAAVFLAGLVAVYMKHGGRGRPQSG